MMISRAHLLAGAAVLLAVGCGADDAQIGADEAPTASTAAAPRSAEPAATTAPPEPAATATAASAEPPPVPAPKAAFAKRADAICLASDGKEVEILGSSPYLHAGNVVEKGPRLVRVIQKKLADLHGLKPPPELAADYARFLAVHERTLDALVTTVEVGGDEAAFEPALAELNARRDELEDAGDALGFTFCP